MSTETQKISAKTYSTTTTLPNLNTISILNGSADALQVSVDGGVSAIRLTEGQTLSLSASTGFVLPDIRLTSAGVITAYVIST